MVPPRRRVVAGAAAGRDHRREQRREATEQAAGARGSVDGGGGGEKISDLRVGGAVAPLPWLGGLLSRVSACEIRSAHVAAGHLLERTLGVMAIEPLSRDVLMRQTRRLVRCTSFYTSHGFWDSVGHAGGAPSRGPVVGDVKDVNRVRGPLPRAQELACPPGAYLIGPGSRLAAV